MKADLKKVAGETAHAVQQLVHVNRRLSANGKAVPFTSAEARELRRANDAYQRALRSFEVALTSQKPLAVMRDARSRVFDGFAGRLMATVRSINPRRPHTFAAIEERAQALSLNKTFGEVVLVRPEKSKAASWRPITLSGSRRRAQQLVLRDLMLVSRGDSKLDSTVGGFGGERALFDQIKHAISDGYVWWAAVDVRDFFPSLRPRHLAGGGHPVPNWMIKNIVFLPQTAKIRVVHTKYGLDLSESEIIGGSTPHLPTGYPLSVGELRAMLSKVRPGLIQGDVISPQIARVVLGSELQQTLENVGVWHRSHLDDVIIGANSQAVLETSIEALTSRLKSLPAGPLELHLHSPSHVNDGFEFLGYNVKRLKHGGIHISPSPKRFNRFSERLGERLNATSTFDKQELLSVAMSYGKQWMLAQPAWTHKVGSDGQDYSANYLHGEIIRAVNQFILDELDQDIGNWKDDDVDWDTLGLDPPAWG